MNHYEVFERPDGVIVAVVYVPGQEPADPKEEIGKRVPQGSRHLPGAKFPSRAFRDCWQATRDGQVDVNLELARQVVLTDARLVRNANLSLSDGAKSRLDEVGTEQQKADLAAYRQALRDIPEVVAREIANLSAEELEDYTPPWPTVPRLG